MSDEDTKAELERLRRENAALKKGASDGIRMIVPSPVLKFMVSQHISIH
jgi:hypothetical protein